MSVSHLMFFLVLTIPLALILLADRENAGRYLKIGIFALILDIVWDPLAMSFGLWHYSTYPQVFGVSIYTLLLYIHYLTFCCFFGDFVNSKVVKGQ